MELKKIASFSVDHTKLDVGMYISRTDGDIVTYDVRMCRPNGGTYMSVPAMHTIEHLFATYLRSLPAFAEHIVYVGPMGCRTGFYFIARAISHGDAISLVREAMSFVRDYEGEIPGQRAAECGNYLEHDLDAAKEEILPALKKLENYEENMLVYPA